MPRIRESKKTIYGELGEKQKDAFNKVRKWPRPSYSSWLKNEERARKFREKHAAKTAMEALYV